MFTINHRISEGRAAFKAARWIPCFLMLALAAPLMGERPPAGKLVLTGLGQPEMIRVSGRDLYVVEGPTIRVFSLDDGTLRRTIGRAGEGPGELKSSDSWFNTVTILPDRIFVDGFDKTIDFSPRGEYLREIKKPVGISRLTPLGRNFVALRLEVMEGGTQYQSLNLYDAGMKPLREICRQESSIQQTTRTLEVIPDVLNYSVDADILVVERSREGFVIDVYDAEGRLLSAIRRESEKIPVTGERRKDALEHLKTHPFVKRVGLEQFQSMSRLKWPDVMPAVRSLIAADGKIYVRTFKSDAGREEWQVFDRKGGLMKNTWLPRVDPAPIIAHLYGVEYLAVKGGRLYFLKDNEETGEWELHIAEFGLAP